VIVCTSSRGRQTPAVAVRLSKQAADYGQSGPSANACRTLAAEHHKWTESSYNFRVEGSIELIGPTTCRRSRASISAVIKAVAPKPVNILVSPQDTVTLAELQTIDVRRSSLGVDPYTHALGATQAAAAKRAKGDLTALASELNFGHIIDLIKGW
jgi:hypothetical protein